MKTAFIYLTTLFLFLTGSTLLAQDELEPFWIYFYDKEFTDAEQFDAADFDFPHLSERAIARRAMRGTITGPCYEDLPVPQSYIDDILADGIEVRVVSRWLNAISVMATQEYIDGLSANSIVKKTKRIHRVSKKMVKRISREAEDYQDDPSYGQAFGQVEQINAVAAHEAGYTGTDVWLLMLDTGYFTDHETFQDARIVAEYDFIQGDEETQNQVGDHDSQHNHGTVTASTAAGYMEGVYKGVAYECKLLLAKTEIVDEEIQTEEDYYVAGLEWGEALGADVASSSLGYLDWYTYSDMDGETAVTTNAVDFAVSLGLVCVTAAGNEGNDPWYYIIAPADADSVIAVGAVNSENEIASFSSHGPTFDLRIKPEVLAQGVGTYAAWTAGTDTYTGANGTSLSTPLVAGAAVLLLDANPGWSPMMVREALMMTADGAYTPDNTRGFGLIDVMAAIDYDFGIVPGDVNGDVELNISDAVLILEWVLNETELDEMQFEVADANNDQLVNVLDIVVIIDWILSL